MDYTEYNAGHLSGQPPAEDAVPKTPTPFRDPAGITPGPSLSAAEIAHFKEHGFIVKRGLLDDHDAFREVGDHLWRNVPRALLRRDDPDSWREPAAEQWTPADVAQVGRFVRGNWKMRSPGPRGIGTEPFLVRRIANHPHLLAVAQALLGAPVQPARRVRGIYAVFPKAPAADGRLAPHADAMAAQLAAMVLVHHVPPRTGAFTLWPRSHRRMHPHWDTIHGGQISAERGEGYRRARDDVLRFIAPVECTGDAGDVVFWHPRMVHSAGVNYSAERGARGGPRVRLVVPCDYGRAGLDYFDDEQFGPGEKYQWWVDTRNFREDVPATRDNLWHGWAV